MEEKTTAFGKVIVASQEELFDELIASFEEAASHQEKVSIGLTGGSTPKAFYPWAVENQKISPSLLQNAIWSCSDERCVPLTSDESNFGNADRLMLSPLGLRADQKFPFPVELDPYGAADSFNRAWNERFGSDTCFDVCVLGMGDDCHTASLFPGSPLLESAETRNFAAVEVPGKGWRLTITEAGLARCGKIIINTLGQGKAEALKTIMHGPTDRKNIPCQMMTAYADKVTWLIDPAAASLLEL